MIHISQNNIRKFIDKISCYIDRYKNKHSFTCSIKNRIYDINTYPLYKRCHSVNQLTKIIERQKSE
jgi:hypothetical protein